MMPRVGAAAMHSRPSRHLTLRYEDDARLFRTPLSRVALAALLVACLAAPFLLGDFWTSVLIYAAIASIGAVGLNLLTGYTGQVSLGHAFFLGAGAYVAAFLSGRVGLPFPLWLIGAAVAGGFIGGVAGPFALRLRGNYLVIVTLGLVVLGQHVFENWRSVTGGLTGIPVRAGVALGGVDFARLSLPGLGTLTRNHGYFYLTWGAAAVLALLAKNVVRTRPGRAMQAIRDRDIAAEVIGVSLVRYKVGAFVVSSAYAAAAGALYASYARYVSPLDFGLALSIQYIAMIVVGGIGTIHGAILGALFLTAVPRLVEVFGAALPFVAQTAGEPGRITVFTLNQAIFGALIIGFLLFEPHGLAGIWLRVKNYFRAWPFSY